MRLTSLLVMGGAMMVLASPAFAVDPTPVQMAQSNAAPAEGEVRRIDKEAGKITLRHGPLVNLDMPAMTMVFQVTDRAMLDKVNVGDKVRFQADKIGGQFTVTQMERAQ